MSTILLRTGLQLALVAGAMPAFAQQDAAPAQRLEITAPRHDVRTVCPTIDEQLHARLARALPMLQNQALVEVQMQIDGREVGAVSTKGGSFDTQVATRRAVRALACDNGSAGRQTVRFEVYYNLDDAPPDRQRTAGTAAVGLAQSGQFRLAN